jgi:DNA-binding transcriptional MerR regulator
MRAMRSKDVAGLAGVSVRTLRHYHQVGILPEPERSANGYRSYDLGHLATLLRIRRLVDLGVPLERVGAFLAADAEGTGGTGGTDPETFLDELDRDLAAQVARLEEQRAAVARLRAERRRPEDPPGFESLTALAALTVPAGSALAAFERDAGQLLARLTGDDHVEDVRRFAVALVEADGAERLAELSTRFEGLGPDAADAEVEAVADDYLALLADHVTAFLDSDGGRRLVAATPAEGVAVDEDPRLNDAQAAVLRLVGDRLDERTRRA